MPSSSRVIPFFSSFVSSSSRADGTIPARATATTASPAATVDEKKPTTVRSGARAGRNRTVTWVTMPRVPSEPTMSDVRS